LERTRFVDRLTRGVADVPFSNSKAHVALGRHPDTPILGLKKDHVVVSTEDPERAATLYGGAARARTWCSDRTHKEWGQLIFFRCGDLIVEIVPGRSAGATTPTTHVGSDMAVADIDAARERLVAGSGEPPRFASAVTRHAGVRPARRHRRHQTCFWNGPRSRCLSLFACLSRDKSRAVSQTMPRVLLRHRIIHRATVWQEKNTTQLLPNPFGGQSAS